MGTIIALIFLACVIGFAFRRPSPPDLREELGQVKYQLECSQKVTDSYAKIISELQANLAKVTGQKKSSEVKTGFMAEALLPLTEQFPCDPKSLRFLGAPVDYIAFDYQKGEITFIECKTGDSQLNENQRQVRDMVESGRVKFVTVRLNEKGIKVK